MIRACLFSLLVGMFVSAAYAQVLPNSRLAAPPSPPPGFLPPPLHPRGVTLETRVLGDGVYALMSNRPFTDNAGFIVGSNEVLVIDSHFNGAMGRQIIKAVRRVSDLPIKYLLNTNAFGDHVFGNYVFSDDTIIVAHQSTINALKISSVQGMSQTMARTVGGDISVFDGVELRLPDVGFHGSWEIDLGGKVVQMYWFGKGMSPNDSVVFVPDANVAWTANLIFGKGTIPWARSGDILAYQETLRNFSEALQPATIVPGHGEIVSGDLVRSYRQYLAEIRVLSEQAVAAGITIDDFVATAHVDPNYEIEPSLQGLMTGFHRWNLKVAFNEVSR